VFVGQAAQRAQHSFPAEWRAAPTRMECTGRHPLKLTVGPLVIAQAQNNRGVQSLHRYQ
jgi:hypothetical protein